MRKILLAGVAMVVATGASIAATTSSTSTQITATVTASCQTPTSSTPVPFGINPVASATATGTVTIQCNFAGDNSGALSVKFSSLNGGIKNGTSLKTYTLLFGATSASSSTFQAPASLSAPTTLVAANTPETQGYTLTLNQTPDVAGPYSDTLTMTVSY